MKTLISMAEFLPEHPYSKFLSQKLEVWMFVPCKLVDGVWVVLEEPYLNYNWASLTKFEKISLIKEYQQSKERVLFNGFEYKGETDNFWILKSNNIFPIIITKNQTVENIIKYNLTLTPTAQKMIGL